MNSRILFLNRLNPPWLYRQLRHRRGGRTSVENASQISKSVETQIENLTKIFDNTQYHDRDFDYIDHKKEQKVRQKFKLDAKSLRYIPKEVRENALFQEDFRDNYSPTNVKTKQKTKSGPIIQAPEKAEKKFLDEDERKIAKMKSRKLDPLPFDIYVENRFEILNSIVSPLHHVPYEEQLKYKLAKNGKIMRALGDKLKLQNSPIRFSKTGMPCPLQPVVASPLITQYRNKDEFTIGVGIDGNTKTVGFNVGKSSKHESVVCVEPDQTIITPALHVEIAHKFQDYLRNVSKLDYCENYGFRGHWRRLIVRSNEQNDVMVIANMHPQKLSPAQLDHEASQLREYFGDSVSSLYLTFSTNIRTTHATSKEVRKHLTGSPVIVDRLFNKSFEISPGSFFQINRPAAERMYHSIIQELDLRNDDIFLDLCCGNGSLSILVSEYCEQVIGIDWTQSSIEDANRNAQLNGIENASFICARIEDILPKICKDFEPNRRIIATLNPSRRGISPSVIHTLKNLKNLFKVVFISCKAEAESLKNMSQLCNEPISKTVERFVPVNAVPVDLFPHTEHCELIVTFERL